MQRLINAAANIYLIAIFILCCIDVHFTVPIAALISFGWCASAYWLWKPVVADISSEEMPSDEWIDY